MLFLLNDQVLDVGDETEALKTKLGARSRAPSLYKAVLLGQQVMFAGGSFHDVHPSAPLRIAALIALSSEANAALFVRADQARGPFDVAVRLAAAPLTTLYWLAQHESEEGLPPGLVNQHVWSLAGRANAA